MATPYCCRSLAYSQVVSSTPSMVPTRSATVIDERERPAAVDRGGVDCVTDQRVRRVGAEGHRAQRAGEVRRRRRAGDGRGDDPAAGAAVWRDQEGAGHPRAVDRDAFGRPARGHDREIGERRVEHHRGGAVARAPRRRAGRDRRRPPVRGTGCRPRPGPAPGPRSPRRRRTRSGSSSSPGPRSSNQPADSAALARRPCRASSSRSPPCAGARSARSAAVADRSSTCSGE